MNTAIILAAGAGTRMKSVIPKVLHRVCGMSMLEHVIKEVKKSEFHKIAIVVGHGSDMVMEVIGEKHQLDFVLQKEQLGTGHAVMQAQDHIDENGNVIILCGDTPLIRTETLNEFKNYHQTAANKVSVMTAMAPNPFGYGRIVHKQDGSLLKIVEEKDASEEEKSIREINSGIYMFDGAFLKKHLNSLNNENAQGEYYLTDFIQIAVEAGEKTGAFLIHHMDELMGVNNKVQLAEAEKLMRKRIAEKHMLNGVSMVDPEHVYIDEDVAIGSDTVIHPGAALAKGTQIGEFCIIGANCRIENSIIGNGTEVQSSTIIDSRVGCNTTVGPYAYLRPKSNVGDNVKIGDFVEVKNATIGNGSKASHLAYIGDAQIGEGVNIGCGVVFVNYDGVNKFQTVIEDGAFIGSNSNLVAPILVKKKGYVAAGSTVTKDVAEGALYVARAKEKQIEGWVERKRKKK